MENKFHSPSFPLILHFTFSIFHYSVFTSERNPVPAEIYIKPKFFERGIFLMKMNKKGFTLIEMLVVIAIIAVLVSIIIPIVGNSTTKAQAATDAANLRSMKATLTIGVMEGKIAKNQTGVTTVPAGYGTAPTSETNAGDTFKFDVSANGDVTVYFGDNKIEHYANIAGGGTDATTPTT